MRYLSVIFFYLSTLIINPMIANATEFEIGVGTHIANYPENPEKYIKLMENYGFSSFRDGFSWNAVEREKGNLSISEKIAGLDSIFSNGREKINVLFVLGYGNKFYTSNGYPRNQKEVDEFLKYVSWVSKKYKGKIKYYEIWNEWLLGTGVDVEKKRSIPSNDIFMYLVKRTSEEIRKNDPDAILMTGSINPLKPAEVDWILELIKKGLLEYVDGISIHPYSFNHPNRSFHNPENNIKYIDDFESKIKSITGKNVNLYITEMGYPTSVLAGGVKQSQAAQDVIKYTLLVKSRDFIKGIWWYDLIDDGNDLFNREHWFGLFTQHAEPKESAILLKKLLSLIKNKNVIVKDTSDKEYHIGINDNNELIKIKWNMGKNYSFDEWYQKVNTPDNVRSIGNGE
ncbi:cellulase family glycosylhydrolase [Brenneria izbisi]|uniref:Glycoside hydrolase family 5 domain-containing protein n=1 Tax=Brenneria izbisi TaxID=2939450 RepID=A0AA42C4J1_9GAMM|nr:cellulase family glycosylhydrolase [Brenneria izbisi]MCV9878016.1 hypothetical protein [Brenneria izbisi]MCV9881420.1 hypothetical protein [Brenneria izbisi]